ncbi:MAG: helix-turn-helix transcriptional regulator [Monoglobales bacterium]
MEDLKVIVASNISRLRKDFGLTQAELAEKINYSDKSVSKWERADALPDLNVTKQLADLFGVSVDFLLTTHTEWKITPPEHNTPSYDSDIITAIAMVGIFAAALLIFLIFFFIGNVIWEIFAYSIGVALICLLVLNNVWKKRRHNLLIISLIVLWVFSVVYISLRKANLWPLLFLLLPAELIVFLSFKIKRRKTTE